MKQVIMYECEFCKKHFKTPNRHVCKYDPKLKNCFTCKHNKGFNEENEEWEYGTYKTIYADCALDMNDLDVRNTPRNMQCFEYEYCGGKWHENVYAKIRQENDSIA